MTDPLPASRQFQGWLEAVNSGNPNRITKFFEEAASKVSMDPTFIITELHPMRTGRLDLREVEEDTETRFSGLLQDRAFGQFKRVTLEVEPGEPWSIARLDVEAIPRPAAYRVPRTTEEAALAELPFLGYTERVR